MKKTETSVKDQIIKAEFARTKRVLKGAFREAEKKLKKDEAKPSRSRIFSKSF